MEDRLVNHLNTYNRIAWMYDPLSKLFLGDEYINSKTYFLDRLKPGCSVLMLGGGTGGNLPEILERIGPQGSLYFMDASSAMIRKAKRRFYGPTPATVHFIHSADFAELTLLRPDFILAHYFLDVLTDELLALLFSKVDQIVNPQTEWIFADFYPVPQKQWLIRIMIRLFRIFVRHPRGDLPDYDSYFERWCWKEKGACVFLGGFIQVKVLSKED